MENQTPITPIADSPQPKAHSFVVILLSILLFISVAIAGFFAYQTQKLVNELRVTRDELKQTQTPEPESTFPMYTEQTPDPTIDWKTYTNEKYGFLFKYPKGWTGTTEPIMPGAQYISLVTFNTNPDFGSQLMVALFPNIKNIDDWVNTIKDSGLIYAKISEIKTINGNVFYDVYGLGSDLKSKDYFIKVGTNGYIKFGMEPYSDTDQKKIFDQILSTFKFIN